MILKGAAMVVMTYSFLNRFMATNLDFCGRLVWPVVLVPK